jgi:hypothetical protein
VAMFVSAVITGQVRHANLHSLTTCIWSQTPSACTEPIPFVIHEFCHIDAYNVHWRYDDLVRETLRDYKFILWPWRICSIKHEYIMRVLWLGRARSQRWWGGR